jgi:hypothetical protein
MTDKKRDEIGYAVFCVNEFARSNGLPYSQSFDYLNRYGAIDFLVDFYEPNSTLPLGLLMEDMRDCCRVRGGTLV